MFVVQHMLSFIRKKPEIPLFFLYYSCLYFYRPLTYFPSPVIHCCTPCVGQINPDDYFHHASLWCIMHNSMWCPLWDTIRHAILNHLCKHLCGSICSAVAHGSELLIHTRMTHEVKKAAAHIHLYCTECDAPAVGLCKYTCVSLLRLAANTF